MAERPPLRVLYTVDTEVWRNASGQPDPDRWLHGRTSAGAYGVGYQVDVLGSHGLRGVFFVEPLFALTAGLDPLKEVVDAIQRVGQDVQLHIHTEWLPDDARPNLRSYTEDDQRRLLALAMQLLAEAGARDVKAFRAGNYGADESTLRALAALGVRYDSSHNASWLDQDCGLTFPARQPVSAFGVTVVPVTVLQPRPGRLRHAQLSALSWPELRHALEQAYALGWSTFVIVSHSFELLTPDRSRPDPVMIRRFHHLCEHLEEHRDRFRAATFNDIEPVGDAVAPLRGSRRLTLQRHAEQALRRLRLPLGA